MTGTTKKRVVFGLVVISLLSFALHCLGYFYFSKTAPTVADQVAGQTYAVNFRGHVSYVTKAAYVTWWWLGLPSFLVFCIAGYLDQKWLVTQTSRDRAARRCRRG